MEQWPAGIAYISCPFDVDRNLYIKECFANSRVSIRMEDGSCHNQVMIPASILNEVEFPLSYKELGSAVGYVTESQKQKPMIFAVYSKNNTIGSGKENSFRFEKKNKKGFILVNGDLDEGTLAIEVNGGEGSSKMHIGIDNDSDTGELEVEVAGSVSIKTTKQTLFENHDEFRSVVSDSAEEEEKQSVISQTKKRILIGNHAVVLNGENIELLHYKGYRITINEDGIEIDALDKAVTIRSGESLVEIDEDGVEIEAKKISLNGSFEALYNKIPGTPIANIKQIGVSKKVKIG